MIQIRTPSTDPGALIVSAVLPVLLERPRIAAGVLFAAAAFLVVLPLEILGVLFVVEAAYSSMRYPAVGGSRVVGQLLMPFLQLSVTPALLGFIFGYWFGGRILEVPLSSRGAAFGRGALIAAASMLVWMAAGLLIVGSMTLLAAVR